jgi:hypothetical protein
VNLSSASSSASTRRGDSEPTDRESVADKDQGRTVDTLPHGLLISGGAGSVGRAYGRRGVNLSKPEGSEQRLGAVQ